MKHLTPCQRIQNFFSPPTEEKIYVNFLHLIQQSNIPSNFPNMRAFKDAQIITTYDLKNPEYKIPALLKIYELHLKLTTTYKNSLNENEAIKENKMRELKIANENIKCIYHKLTNTRQRDASGKSKGIFKKKNKKNTNLKIWNKNYENANTKKYYLELSIKNLENSINALNSLKNKNLFKETFKSLYEAKRAIFNLENSKPIIKQKTKYLNLITTNLERFSKIFIEENRFDLKNKENKEILDKIQSLVEDIHDYILHFIDLVKSEFKEDEEKIATPKFLSLFETWILNFISCYASLTNNIKMKDCSIKYFFYVVDYLTTLYVADDEMENIDKNKERIGEIIKRLKFSEIREFKIHAHALQKLKDDLAINIILSYIESIRKGEVDFSEKPFSLLIGPALSRIPYFIIQELLRKEASKICNEFNLSRPEETTLKKNILYT